MLEVCTGTVSTEMAPSQLSKHHKFEGCEKDSRSFQNTLASLSKCYGTQVLDTV